MNYFYYLFGIIFSALFFLYSTFKYKQIKGSDYKNKRLRDKHGEGSFFSTVANFMRKIFWSIMLLTSVLTGIYCYLEMTEISSNANTPKKFNKKISDENSEAIEKSLNNKSEPVNVIKKDSVENKE